MAFVPAPSSNQIDPPATAVAITTFDVSDPVLVTATFVAAPTLGGGGGGGEEAKTVGYAG